MSSTLGRGELASALDLSLSDAQWAAVSAPLEPAVIVAGAGTGKTTSMSARVAYLVGSGLVSGDRVLGLTFTNKAAGQLLSAIRMRIDAVAELATDLSADSSELQRSEPTVSTYHAFAGRIVSEFGLRIGREPDATLLIDGIKHMHAYRVVCGADVGHADAVGTSLARLGRQPKTITENMLALDGELSELAIDPAHVIEHDRELVERLAQLGADRGTAKEIREAAQQRIALCRLIQEWRDYKARRDLWDYSDYMRLAMEIVDRFPETATQIRQRYDVVLLDEYQDTSIAQRELLQAIFGAGFPVTAVGDPCQAIYGWRGASVDNIDSFPLHFPCADGSPARRYTLTENRRSGPAILHVANQVSSNLRDEHSGAESLIPVADAPAASVSVGLFETMDGEIDYIAHSVKDAHDAAERNRARGTPDTIAVLCTTGADIRRIDVALQRLGVPTQVTGAAALLADPAVADLRSLLEAVYEPTANPSTVRLLTGARWRVGNRDLAALGTRARDLAGGGHRPDTATVDQALQAAVVGSDPVDVVSLTDAIADPGDLDRYSAQARLVFEELSSIIDQLRRYPGESIVDLIAQAMALLGVDVEARVNDPTGTSSAALADFMALAAEMTDAEGRIGLGGFLARLRDAERFDVNVSHTRPARDGAVQIMTVFAAKGLEFSRVYVPFVSEGTFPGGKSRGRWTTGPSIVPWPLRQDVTAGLDRFPDGTSDSVNKQHERYKQALQRLIDLDHERLAYVGLTRAENSLTVTGHWWGTSRETVRGPHRFLTQIRDAVLEADPDLCRVITWAEAPMDGDHNPATLASRSAWPQVVEPSRRHALTTAADLVRTAQRGSAHVSLPLPLTGGETPGDDWDSRVVRWHEAFVALSEQEEQVSHERVVRLGPHVGATQFLRALKDPDALALDVLRPVPRKPSRAASLGIAWHAWVETVFGQQSLWGLDDLPGAADSDIVTAEELTALQEAFMRCRFASSHPAAIEQPFSLVLGGRVINGRIDAVFESDGRFEVVDWKTGSTASIDPRQLAIYRLAWSYIAGVPWRAVDATFFMVATGEEVHPDTDAEVESLLAMDARPA